MKDLDQALREAQNRWVRVQKARGSMPNNTGEFAARVAALRARLDAAQMRLADVAKQQNGLLESLARNELEQQKERIGTYQIQARFALAAIYDRAAAPPSARPGQPRRRNRRANSRRCPQDDADTARRSTAHRRRARPIPTAPAQPRRPTARRRLRLRIRRSRASTLRQHRPRRRNEPARH